MDMTKKTIAIMLMTAMAAVTGTAMLVEYLSNEATATINVESPLILTFSTDGLEYASMISLGNVYGGETAGMYAKLENKANATIETVIVAKLNSAGNTTCDDLTAIYVDMTDVTKAVKCNDKDGTATYTSDVMTLAPFEAGTAQISFTFNEAIEPAAYSITGQAFVAKA